MQTRLGNSRQGGSPCEGTVPTLHCPLDKNIFPTVTSEPPHPKPLASPTHANEELGSPVFVTQIPQDCVGGCQWFLAIGFHVNTRAGV